MPREIARGIATPSGEGNIIDIERLQFVSDCEITEKRTSRENHQRRLFAWSNLAWWQNSFLDTQTM